jgi:hypothetical protein
MLSPFFSLYGRKLCAPTCTFVCNQPNKLLKHETSALSLVTGGSIPNGDVHRSQMTRNSERILQPQSKPTKQICTHCNNSHSHWFYLPPWSGRRLGAHSFSEPPPLKNKLIQHSNKIKLSEISKRQSVFTDMLTVTIRIVKPKYRRVNMTLVLSCYLSFHQCFILISH